jgi:DNA-binding SARP family transcriptional activator/predicted ATPase
MLAINLLGAPQVRQDDQPLTITRKKSRALLYYLAAHTRPLTREHLLAFFWPDQDRASAQQVLRTTLHGLRKALGSALVVNEATLAVAPEVVVDVRVFEAQLANLTSNLQPSTPNVQHLTATLQLYRGDFLSDFVLGDAAEFDDWAFGQQEHYRRLAVRGYVTLSALHEQQGDYAAALDALDRALKFDRLQEDLQRAALRLHYLAGDRAGAIRRYELLRKLLDEELGVPPMAETRALYDEIISDRGVVVGGQASVASEPRQSLPLTTSRQPPTTDVLPFIGRADELRRLRAALTAGQLAVIEGEPGIGKTRLAHEAIRAEGRRPLVAAAHELEHALPYQPLIEALRALLAQPDWPARRARLQLADVWQREVARLVPELGEAPSTAVDESRLWEGLRQFLLAVARTQPIALLLDDLQWADASTVALLGYLVRSTGADRAVAFIATLRPIEPRGPIGALWQSLAREQRLVRLALDRLSADETTALARHISPTFAYPLADWLMRQSEGNPYMLSELIQHARVNGLLQPDGTLNLNALSAAPIVPPNVYALIESRLARLSGGARRVLDAGVAAGRVFEFDVVARAAGLSDQAALDALDELRAARLIQPQGDDGLHFAFDHTLTMEVAYRDVGEPRHRVLHRRVAEAMEAIYGKSQLDPLSGLIAWHFIEGHDAERAAPYAVRAAELAMNFAAWREAIEFYEQALQANLPTTRRAEILSALGRAHNNAGETDRAAESHRAALRLVAPDSDLAHTIRLALAQALLGQARFGEVIDLMRYVRDHGQPDQQINAELIWGAALSIEGADLIEAADHLQKAEALLRQSERCSAAQLAQTVFELGSIAAQQGDLPRAVDLYRQTLAIAEQTTEPEALPFRVLAYNNLAYHLHLLNDPTALEYVQTGLQLAVDNGVLAFQPYLLSTLGEIQLAQGDLDAAEKHFNEGLALAERLSLPERLAGLTANLGLVAQRRGENALAIHRLSTALARAEALNLKHLAAQIRVWLAPLLPVDEARAHLAEARSMAESSGRKRLLAEIEAASAQLSDKARGR